MVEEAAHVCSGPGRQRRSMGPSTPATGGKGAAMAKVDSWRVPKEKANQRGIPEGFDMTRIVGADNELAMILEK